MKNTTIMKTGIVGSVIAAICCASPVLVIALGAVGMSAWLGWIDYALLPTLVIFLCMTAYALLQRHRAAACCASETQTTKESS